jgi:hypothetical protein
MLKRKCESPLLLAVLCFVVTGTGVLAQTPPSTSYQQHPAVSQFYHPVQHPVTGQPLVRHPVTGNVLGAQPQSLNSENGRMPSIPPVGQFAMPLTRPGRVPIGESVTVQSPASSGNAPLIARFFLGALLIVQLLIIGTLAYFFSRGAEETWARQGGHIIDLEAKSTPVSRGSAR